MSGSQGLRLTDEQEAIVAHGAGPALVYAVAGAGKTTAMVHRIARLVRGGHFRAEEILATSFNRDANTQIKTALRRWPSCKGVDVKTLHALGYQIVRLAAGQGLFSTAHKGSGMEGPERAAYTFLKATIDHARRQKVTYADRLDGLDWDEFLTYIGTCKGNLAYADHRAIRLPRRNRRTASQAKAPPDRPWFLDLYRLYEALRRQANVLTFDDMLMTAWELLVCHPDLLDTVRGRYNCVIVDEFQDMNLAQIELLDLLTMPHRNYMAIGDDDQTIYQWRGADPEHFRRFRRRYRARVYTMTENFRCSASQIALANQIIRHNRDRQPKVLGLTQGFGGETTVTVGVDEMEMAVTITREIEEAMAAGHRAADIAILVRLYAQVPILEEALRAAGIAYYIDGEMPYYLRRQTEKNVPGQGKPAGGKRAAVTITTIFRAKGLEWPVVIIPHCNQGIIPMQKSPHVAEERRLFYVALTRAQDRLHLHVLADRPISTFLVEADYSNVLKSIRAVRHALALNPARWNMPEFLAVGVNIRRLDLHTYFLRWWRAPGAHRLQVAGAVLSFYASLQQRRLFRKLGLGREDVSLWQSIAGSKRPAQPLNRPDLEESFARLPLR